MENRFLRALAVGAVSVGAFGPSHPAWAQLQANTLRCEYAVNPLGVDEARPRLSWLLSAAPSQRGARQSAYQVLVASSQAGLRANKGDLWDSGAVKSNAQNQIEYAGQPLLPRTRVWWKVRSWDGEGRAGKWSAPAWWESGLGSGPSARANWGAKWIAPASSGPEVPSLGQASWVWTGEGSLQAGMPGGARFFRSTFEAPAGLTAATLRLTVDDTWTLWINGQQVAKSGNDTNEWRNFEPRDILKYLRPGRNTIAVEGANREGAAGLLSQIEMKSAAGGSVVRSGSSWKWSGTSATGWQNADFDDSAWAGVAVVAPYGEGPWGQFASGEKTPDERYLRREFTIAKPIVRARLYATALGLYEPRVNGRKVGRDIFAPGWTEYRKRVQYQSYDVTSQVKRGANALAISLGDGWYCGQVGLMPGRVYGTRPMAMCRLEVEHPDGTRTAIVSDESWQSAKGPTTRADLIDGESFDARRIQAGWDAPNFRGSGWKSAQVLEGRDGVTDLDAISIEAERGPSVRVTQELKARSVRQAAPGKWVFDMGQNMVGWVRLQVLEKAGAKVTLRFAEMLNPDGTIYTTNYRRARCLDEYTARGGAREVWEPSFTFRGFRYVEVSGLSAPPSLATVTGVVAHSDTPMASALTTSNPMVNQLQKNIVWGQRGNFLSVPTDCPQRDERLGWMGDAQVFVATAAYNADVAGFFNKWMVDVEDATRSDGAFPDVAPHVAVGFGTAAWGDAGIIVPWSIYQAYGDTRILERHYGVMSRYIAWCWEHSNGGIRPAQGYGDWLQIAADTPRDVLATAYFAYSTKLMANIAQVLGKQDDTQRFTGEFEKLKAAFNREFVGSDGRIKGNTQTGYLIALRFGLLDGANVAAASKYLGEDIASKGDHLSTGFVGVGYLNPVLTQTGQSKTAYSLLLNDTFPSWGYSIRQGATTIWERWDGWTKDKGFQDAGMNSFNHYSLGSVGQWMFESMAGIGLDAQKPAFEHIVVRPQIDPRLSYARASHDSIRGRIASSWQKKDGILTLNVTVPANCTATVWVPNASGAQVSEGRVAAAQAKGVQDMGREGGASKFEVGSGTYTFQVRA